MSDSESEIADLYPNEKSMSSSQPATAQEETLENLEGDIQDLGRRLKHHQQNIKCLKTRINSLDYSIQDLQVMLGKYHLEEAPVTKGEDVSVQSKEEIPLTKDILGVVAMLAKVNDENLSRLLSEYLGLETMLAVVCTTIDGMKAIEKYDREGSLSKCSVLSGLEASIGRHLDGQFTVICLEMLRPYVGEFVADGSQRRLDLHEPRLLSGELPKEMMTALPLISHGAISLDGGILNTNGVFRFGTREETDVVFPITSEEGYVPEKHVEMEERLKEKKSKKQMVLEDLRHEEAMHNYVRYNLEIKKREFVNVRLRHK